MKLVFINRFFHPDLSATSQMLSELAVDLAAKGHEVHVVCSRQLYGKADAQLPREQIVSGVQVHRAWSTRFGRGRLLGRAIDYLSFYVGAYRALQQVVSPGCVVVAKTDPPLISIPASWVARRRDAHLVNWLQDIFPEVAERLDVLKAGSLFSRVLKGLRDASLRLAAQNVVIGERMGAVVAARGIPAHCISVVPNWSDANAAHSLADEANPLVDAWGLRGKFVVMYSGNLGRAHEFDTILAAAHALRGEEHIRFVFVGTGARRPEVERKVEALGLPNVQFRPFQPQDRLVASLSVGDVHLISLMPSQEGLIVPSKFYGVMAVSRPTLFVGATDGELARVIGLHGIGATAAVGDACTLAQHITKLARHPELCRSMGRKAHQLFVDEYQPKIAFARWEAVLIAASQGATSPVKESVNFGVHAQPAQSVRSQGINAAADSGFFIAL